MSRISKALVLAPHTDDGELGCGGTVARLVEEGCRVFYAAFSICEESVPPGFERDALLGEVRAATAVLGVRPEDLFVLRHKVRRFDEVRQEILEYLVRLRGQLEPEWVFVPSSRAVHQDHQVIHREAMRTFKRHTCLGYDLPWDTPEFATTAFQALEERHVEAKASAMREYETQAHRGYASREFIRSLARVRGEQIGRDWAEAFEVLRLML